MVRRSNDNEAVELRSSTCVSAGENVSKTFSTGSRQSSVARSTGAHRMKTAKKKSVSARLIDSLDKNNSEIRSRSTDQNPSATLTLNSDYEVDERIDQKHLVRGIDSETTVPTESGNPLTTSTKATGICFSVKPSPNDPKENVCIKRDRSQPPKPESPFSSPLNLSTSPPDLLIDSKRNFERHRKGNLKQTMDEEREPNSITKENATDRIEIFNGVAEVELEYVEPSHVITSMDSEREEIDSEILSPNSLAASAYINQNESVRSSPIEDCLSNNECQVLEPSRQRFTIHVLPTILAGVIAKRKSSNRVVRGSVEVFGYVRASRIGSKLISSSEISVSLPVLPDEAEGQSAIEWSQGESSELSSNSLCLFVDHDSSYTVEAGQIQPFEPIALEVGIRSDDQVVPIGSATLVPNEINSGMKLKSLKLQTSSHEKRKGLFSRKKKGNKYQIGDTRIEIQEHAFMQILYEVKMSEMKENDKTTLSSFITHTPQSLGSGVVSRSSHAASLSRQNESIMELDKIVSEASCNTNVDQSPKKMEQQVKKASESSFVQPSNPQIIEDRSEAQSPDSISTVYSDVELERPNKSEVLNDYAETQCNQINERSNENSAPTVHFTFSKAAVSENETMKNDEGMDAQPGLSAPRSTGVGQMEDVIVPEEVRDELTPKTARKEKVEPKAATALEPVSGMQECEELIPAAEATPKRTSETPRTPKLRFPPSFRKSRLSENKYHRSAASTQKAVADLENSHVTKENKDATKGNKELLSLKKDVDLDNFYRVKEILKKAKEGAEFSNSNYKIAKDILQRAENNELEEVLSAMPEFDFDKYKKDKENQKTIMRVQAILDELGTQTFSDESIEGDVGKRKKESKKLSSRNKKGSARRCRQVKAKVKSMDSASETSKSRKSNHPSNSVYCCGYMLNHSSSVCSEEEEEDEDDDLLEDATGSYGSLSDCAGFTSTESATVDDTQNKNIRESVSGSQDDEKNSYQTESNAAEDESDTDDDQKRSNYRKTRKTRKATSRWAGRRMWKPF